MFSPLECPKAGPLKVDCGPGLIPAEPLPDGRLSTALDAPG